MEKNEYGLLLDRILAHPGQQLHDLLGAHDISKNMLWGNCHQLTTLLKKIEDPENSEEIFARDNYEKRPAVFREINRLFHNFVSSAKTLVDHTRVLLEAPLIDAIHRKETQDEIQRIFGSDSTIKFVHDMRNYMNHRTIPIVELSMQIIGTQEPIIAAKLNLEKMSQWEKWTAQSKDFISQHGKECRILPLVTNYEKSARAFHDGFNLPFLRFYRTEFNEVQSLWTKFNAGAGR